MTIGSVALMFPGQGSQYAAMAKNLPKEYRHFLKTADEVLGYPLSELMLEGPDEKLKLTHNAQPAILTHSIALYQLLSKELEQKGISIACVLGHSVGEYSALVASGVLSFEEALMAVHLRGKFMQEAVLPGKGKMIAVMRGNEKLIEQACLEVSQEDNKVMPANFNGPDQIVISGHSEACQRAVEWLQGHPEAKVRTIELNVSAPFHCSLMQPAALKLQEAFAKFTFNSNKLTYIANIDALEYAPGTNAQIIKDNLIKQVTGSVRWAQSVAQLPSTLKCFEVGPSKVLTGLAKKINPELQVLPLDQGADQNPQQKILEFLA